MSDAWPELQYAAWKETRDTLHMWTQIVGKTALSHSPLTNHWWNCGLTVTERGLSTAVLYEGKLPFRIEFDLVDHALYIYAKRHAAQGIKLASMPVAGFYRTFIDAMRKSDLTPAIWPVPVEIPNPIPFAEDTQHATYEREPVERFHHTLLSVQRVLSEFRARNCGKCSPVLFWWGTFDIALTLFSGRLAPPREGADRILREAMSHEEISIGWWPGDASFPEPAFYAYAAPEPPGFASAQLQPAAAYYSAEKGEFFLPYEAVRKSADPETLLLQFCQSAYGAGALLGRWDPALLRTAAL
jgi:hypothetical protein